jgi:hypothetical protein
MQSGDKDCDRNDHSIIDAFSKIKDPNFFQLEFHPKAALIKKEPVNGLRQWAEYKGGPFDETKFTKVEGYWDPEHSSVCWFTIQDGHAYWSNKRGITLLCDECQQAFAARR